jgi:hypothetical protein
MAVSFMRRLLCADPIQSADGIAVTIGNDLIARLLCEEFTLSRAEIAVDAGRVATPTNNRRDDMLRTRDRAQASIHGDAID